MNRHVSLAVSISREEVSNLKRIEMKIEKSSVKLIIGEGNKYEINYTQFCLLACVGCVQVFVKQDGDVYLMFDTSP